MASEADSERDFNEKKSKLFEKDLTFAQAPTSIIQWSQLKNHHNKIYHRFEECINIDNTPKKKFKKSKTKSH